MLRALGATTVSGKSVDSLVKEFEQQFVAGAKKKKINPLKYSATYLIKRNQGK